MSASLLLVALSKNKAILKKGQFLLCTVSRTVQEVNQQGLVHAVITCFQNMLSHLVVCDLGPGVFARGC